MGQIVISDVDDTVIYRLEQHAAAMHMSLGESLRLILVKLAGQSDGKGVPALKESKEPNGTLLARLAREYASSELAAKFGDPVEWQRQQRRDRPLPGREE